MVEQIITFLTQDVTGLAAQLFFTLTILFMIFDKQKPPLATSILTGLALIVLGAGGSFSAPAVAAVSMANGGLWLFLAWQRYNQPQTFETLPARPKP
jgi:hypothetical protein